MLSIYSQISMKTIVIYYSNKGSNNYLAQKISKSLSCDIEEIKPRLNVFILFLMGVNLGNKRIKSNIAEYDRIILCGPIWMGKLIPPLRSFIKKYFDSIQKLAFVTCCGSCDEKKDDKFGYGLVFDEVESILKDKCVLCKSFSINLVLPEDRRDDPDAFMKTHLSDENFKGEIKERFDMLIEQLTTTNGAE